MIEFTKEELDIIQNALTYSRAACETPNAVSQVAALQIKVMDERRMLIEEVAP